MKKSNKKFINRIIIASSIALAIGLGASSVYGYSSWIFTDSQVGERNVEAFVPDWSFSGGGALLPGDVIIINEDGTITVNGETVEGEMNADGDTYNYGDVSITVEVDEDGNLVLSDFTTSNQEFALLGSTIYLPNSIVIDGETYPVTGISHPLNIDVSDPIWGTAFYNNNVYVPSGYTYICDGAFASLTKKTIFHLPDTITSIGSGAFMPGNNVTQTINYAGSQAQWNAIDKATNYENGAGNINIRYNTN